nr:N-acetylmuramoyl-L-alanine amidase [uncultured Actinotalea sp.]
MASTLAVAPWAGGPAVPVEGPGQVVVADGRAPASATAPAGSAADGALAAPEGASVTEVPITLDPPPDMGLAALRTAPEGPAGAVVADEPAPGDRVLTDPIDLGVHQTVGLSWDAAGAAPDVRMRSRGDGAWGPWVTLEQADEVPDAGTADAVRAATARAATDPVWLGDATDQVQLSFGVRPGAGPAGLSLLLVGSPEEPPAPVTGPSAATDDAGGTGELRLAQEAGAGFAALPARRVISRAEWGAPGQVCAPDVAGTLTHVVLHHTAGSNSYATVAQAMQQLRNDALYHINGRGWCDIGYNFVVDKWGNIYEGRAGSASAPVIGVHAGGFNTRSLGISMLGTYGTVAPSAAVQESVAWLAAWRLGAYFRDPAGTVRITTPGGENSSVPAGATVTLPVVFGHRDVAYTACPGNAGYATLPWIRSRARQLDDTTIVDPSLVASRVARGAGATMSGAAASSFDWTLTVTDDRTGVRVGGAAGWATPASGFVASWDGRNGDGVAVGAGAYRMTLVASRGGVPVRTFSTVVEVTGAASVPTAPAVPLVPDLTFVPVTPVRVLDTRPKAQSLGAGERVDVVVAGVRDIPADARAVAVNVTAVHASATTFVRAWPAGAPQPDASVLNADPSRDAGAAGVVLGVGGERKISLFNNAGSVHLLVDVTGYYTAAPGAGRAHTSLPQAFRALDTRTGGGVLTSGARRTVPVAGREGVPADATAVVLNVTSVAPAGDGYVAALPAGGPVGTSTVNHLPGRDASNRTTVALAGGAVDVYLEGAAAHVAVDVVGWYGPSGGQRFTPVQPVRVADSRWNGWSALGEGQTRTVPVSGPAGLPAGTRAVTTTLTSFGQSAPATYLTVWAAGAPRPGTSDLNTGQGRDQANMVVAPLGTGGGIQVYNDRGTTGFAVDVTGYFD